LCSIAATGHAAATSENTSAPSRHTGKAPSNKGVVDVTLDASRLLFAVVPSLLPLLGWRAPGRLVTPKAVLPVIASKVEQSPVQMWVASIADYLATVMGVIPVLVRLAISVVVEHPGVELSRISQVSSHVVKEFSGNLGPAFAIVRGVGTRNFV